MIHLRRGVDEGANTHDGAFPGVIVVEDSRGEKGEGCAGKARCPTRGTDYRVDEESYRASGFSSTTFI